jgi:SAM-dependent methyltransferase
MSAPRFDAVSPESIAALAGALARGGFHERFLGRCEAVAPQMLDPVRLPVVHAWLREEGGAAAIIARLFAYGDVVTQGELAPVLGADVIDALAEAGLLARDGDAWRSAIRIVPLHGALLASDPMEAEGDPVLGPGATTQELQAAMPVPRGGRVLDVGTGAGSLAVCAAKAGAAEVTGVDLHPRAAEVARFNAALNGIELRVHTGDLTAPVAGQRFDLVVAQPPFVVKPPDVPATTYLHGGERGDELTMRLLSELPGVLADGGRALVLFDTLDDPATATRRVAQALGSAPLRVVVVATPGLSADRLAIGYAAIAHPRLDAGYAAAATRYFLHLRRLQATRAHHLLVDVRRDPSAERSFAVTVTRRSLAGLDAAALLRTEAAVDLATDTDAALLDARLSITPGASIEQAQALDGGHTTLRVRWADPGRDAQELSDAAAVVVDALRHGGTGRDALAAYAEAAETRPAEVHEAVLDFLRSALVSGLLAPA